MTIGIGRVSLLAAALSLTVPQRATAALKVVTTTEGLAALANEVGGDRVQVRPCRQEAPAAFRRCASRSRLQPPDPAQRPRLLRQEP